MTRALALLAITACSGGSSTVRDDATGHPRSVSGSGSGSGSGSVSVSGSGSGSGAGAGSGRGDLAVKVEWKSVPVGVRSSPGRTACHTERAPAVVPSTLWGIADVVVIADAPRTGGDGVRFLVGECAIAPRVAVTAPGAAVTVVSRDLGDAPITVGIARRGTPAALDQLGSDTSRPIALPIAGHEVAVAVPEAALDELTIPDGDGAWLVATPQLAAVTDAAGGVVLHDLALGPHAITAWLPPRAGQPARVVHGSATVVGGELAELTLELAP